MADLFGHEAPPVAPGFVEIACELRKETHDGIAIVNGTGELQLGDGRESWKWLPKAHVTKIVREGGRSVVITIPSWLAQQERLI
jgi:hypothetical protein